MPDSPPVDRRRGEDETEETQDESPVQTPPLWTTGGSPREDLTPPPTYDPSSFPATLTAMPTFKPRNKSNRVSVLAYPTDGSLPDPKLSTPPSVASPPLGASTLPGLVGAGGPPSLFGAGAKSAAGSRATTPTGGSLGIKLPPPPMKGPTGAGAVTPATPYTRGDFRTAEIVNHWNDPPTKIFDKNSQNSDAAAFDFGPMKESLSAIIHECSINVAAPQKRMFEDTTKRLQVLQDQMESGTVKERVVAPLNEMIQALSSKSFAKSQAIHAKLMQTEFESEGKWLLGFKRLIDLYTTLAPPAGASDN
ncbi:hypothetical protein BGZ99_006305 [Dissophora globulifera]|uniref:SRA1/Sec31 domain-containing protein n=1 Tax=Dissophora globulifera TaxID=979702 RepID=A0A9P6RDV2_9FUNG|nr:hypothetical protein BGZ99_006305 [Dissophora globulifera]